MVVGGLQDQPAKLYCLTADNVMELHRAQERRMYTCGPGLYREHRERRGDRGDPALAREMEELRARTQQMEKTLK